MFRLISSISLQAARRARIAHPGATHEGPTATCVLCLAARKERERIWTALGIPL